MRAKFCSVSRLNSSVRGFKKYQKLWLLGVLLWAWIVPTASHADTQVALRCALGSLVIQLFDTDKPITVQNFLRYVREGRYTNMFSHRLIPGFVMQAGGFSVTNRNTVNADFFDIPDYGTIKNEFGVGPKLSNVLGTIAMAKSPTGPDTASSEWFINLGDNSTNLDIQNGGFTVFGKVVTGLELLDLFNQFAHTISASIQPTNRLFNLTGTEFPFDSRPNPPAFPLLRIPSTFAQVFTNALFLELVELTSPAPESVVLAPFPSGKVSLTWSNLQSRKIVLEYTQSFPPVWNLLSSEIRTGTGSLLLDPIPADVSRFYRVRAP